MKIEIVDAFGSTIECTLFNEAVEKFCSRIKEDRVYLFSNGQVKLASKKFSSIKNDFCLIFEPTSSIEETNDDGTIPQINFSYDHIQF